MKENAVSIKIMDKNQFFTIIMPRLWLTNWCVKSQLKSKGKKSSFMKS